MVKSTIIARVADGLPLAASMDDEESVDLQEYKNQAKLVFKKLNQSAETSYILSMGVCFLALCDKSYPKVLAFQYLEELETEFNKNYGTEVGSVGRPYAFVKFDTFIQKVKKQYKDTRSQKNLGKLNEDLQDVQRIMTKNIQEVLGRGEHLNKMSEFSASLSAESKKYLKDAKRMNLNALYQKYGPLLIVAFVILLVLFLRFYWW